MKNKLSFEDDLEEESFKIVRKKVSRPTSFNDSNNNDTTQNVATSYSKHELNSLRNAQKYTRKQHATSSSIEGIELCGEEAEKFVELTEQAENRKKKVKFNEDIDNQSDFIALQAGKASIKEQLNKSEEEKVTMSSLFAKDKLEFYDNGLDDTEWEEEIMKRGVISGGSIAPKASNYTDNVSNQPQSRREYTITLLDVMKSVQLAIDKLKFGFENADKRTSHVSVDVEKLQEEKKRLEDKINQEVAKANDLQDIRIYFSSVVGMIREKSKLIEENKNKIQHELKSISKQITQIRLEQQEDSIYTIKEHNELLTIGDYTPKTSILLLLYGSSDSNNDSNSKQEQLIIEKSNVVIRNNNRLLESKLTLQKDTSLVTLLSEHDQQCYIQHGNIASMNYISASCNSELFHDLLIKLDLTIQLHQHTMKQKIVPIETMIRDSIMLDVESDIRSISEIVKKLSLFRSQYPEKFHQAYILLSIFELLKPLIWLELLQYNSRVLNYIPTVSEVFIDSEYNGNSHGNNNNNDDDDSAVVTMKEMKISYVNLQEMEWYRTISQFANESQASRNQLNSSSDNNHNDNKSTKKKKGVTFGGATSDSDNLITTTNKTETQNNKKDENEINESNLLSKLVGDTVIPWLISMVKYSLDPLSYNQWDQCVYIIKQLLSLSAFSSNNEVNSANSNNNNNNNSLLSPLFIEIELVFHTFFSQLCLPEIKMNADSDYGRNYLLQRYYYIILGLENLSKFVLFLQNDRVIMLVWNLLQMKCLPSFLRVFNNAKNDVNNAKHVTVVLRICHHIHTILIAATMNKASTTTNSHNGINFDKLNISKESFDQFNHCMKVVTEDKSKLSELKDLFEYM